MKYGDRAEIEPTSRVLRLLFLMSANSVLLRLRLELLKNAFSARITQAQLGGLPARLKYRLGCQVSRQGG